MSGAPRGRGRRTGSARTFLGDQLSFPCTLGPPQALGGPFPEGQSKPKSLGLCVFQSLGSSLVSLYQAFRRQRLWMSDGPWARPFLYANPRKLFTRFAHLGDLSPLLPNLGWDSRRQCVLSSCVEGGSWVPSLQGAPIGLCLSFVLSDGVFPSSHRLCWVRQRVASRQLSSSSGR